MNDNSDKTTTQQDIIKLKKEVEETCRGVLELVDEMHDPDCINEINHLRQEVQKLSLKLEETYRGVIELATNLENDEKTLQGLAEGAGLGLWEWSTADNTLSVNNEWLSIVGLNNANFNSTLACWDELVHPDDIHNLKKQRNNLKNGNKVFFHSEHRIKTGDNTWRWVLVNAKIHDDANGNNGQKIAGALLDIDPRKQAELKILKFNTKLEKYKQERTSEIELINYQLMEEIRDHQRTIQSLREANKMAKTANQAKYSFLSHMNHELRTPLQIILGYSQIMQLDKNLTPQQRDNLSSINRSGNHLHELINNVLTASDIEAGSIEHKPVDFNLSDLIDDIDNFISPLIQGKNLYFKVEMSADLPQFIKTDAVKLRQILINLIGNSVKFTDTGGITLRLGIANQSDELLFEIKGTGQGISDSELDSLFLPFEQGLAGQFRSGTGLGLTITREYVNLLGGKLSVTSSPGEGSCYSFTMPFENILHFSPNADTPSKSFIKSGHNSKAISAIVVDNNDKSLTNIKDLLNKLDIKTIAIHTAEEAINILGENTPDVIFYDIALTDMNELSLAHQIHKLSTDDSTPVILITDDTSINHRKIISEYGALAVLRKPIKLTQITNTLSQALNVQFPNNYNINNSEINPVKYPEASDLTILPDKLKLKLRSATEYGDFNELHDCLNEINQKDKELASSIGYLVNQFNYEKLLEILN